MSLPIHHTLSGPRPYPVQPLPGNAGLGLMRGRVHEACGPSRVTFAAFVMNQSQGKVIWILPGWQAERLYPPGLHPYADAGRIIFARVRRPEDLLWSVEEALRSGAAPLVVAELLQPPGLTPIRRFHLAAEAGAEAARRWGRLPPLGLLLTPEMGGAQGVESRWHMRPRPSKTTIYENHAAWEITRLRARIEPIARWQVSRDPTGAINFTADRSHA